LRIQPLGDRLVVKVAEVTEEKTKAVCMYQILPRKNLKKQKY
jgi:co-chaperonin GroES (HSP10)